MNPVDIVRRIDGSVLLVPRGTLGTYPARVTDWLVRHASTAPDRTFVAQRLNGGDWIKVSYDQALERVRALAAGLIQHRLSAERPVAILSGNGIDHLLLGLAALHVGVPYVPVSPAYSQAAGDLGRLRHVLALTTPGLVAAFGPGDYSRAVAVAPPDAKRLTDGVAFLGSEATPLDAFTAPADSSWVERAHDQVTADSIAKLLLTSGSTGHPKAVITTHRMLCANQMMIHQALPFLSHEPPVLVDWLPWNHVFGGSHNVGIVLAHGGTLYIDDGRPSPAGIRETVRNLREISPTVYFNVPKGFEALLPHLAADAELRHSYFKRLHANFYAAAGLSQAAWDAMDALALRETGRRIPMIAGLGATETAPSVTFTTAAMGRAGAIGLPVAGNTVKLAPVDGKLELRVRGANVTPGYWRQPELNARAFDEEGFFRLGDAVRFVSDEVPELGLAFDGRIAEDFKLSTGTWVSVGPLRATLLAELAPLAEDLAIVGLNRDDLGALLFIDVAGCRAYASANADDAGRSELARDPGVTAEFRRRLADFAARHPASSHRIGRARLLPSSPSPEKGEITDKGSLNQRAVLASRAADVEMLYSEPAQDGVIRVIVSVAGEG